MKKVKNINEVKKILSKSIIISVLIPLIFILIIVNVFNYRQNEIISSKNQNILRSNIETLISDISEKISIVASSNIFTSYLRSGKNTRKDLYSSFNIQLGALIVPEINGLLISDTRGDIFYNIGKQSSQFIKIPLCYLDSELNSNYGQCLYSMTLFLNQKGIIKSLKKINVEIFNDNNNKINFIDTNHFGSFFISSFKQLKLNINIPNSYHYYYLYSNIVLVFLIFLIYYFLRYKIKNIFQIFIRQPINNLISSLNSGENLKIDYGIEEINFLNKEIMYRDLRMKQIRQNEKLIEIGSLTSKIAHDIRSPIHSLDLLMDICKNKISEDNYSLMKNATYQINNIANDILNKYSSDKDIDYIFLEDTISMIIKDFKLKYTNSNCKIVFLSNSRTTLVHIQQDVFVRIINNIIKNSFDAIGNNVGTISILTSVLYDKIKIKISDDGIGVPQEQIEEINSNNIKTTKKSGHGLGLKYVIDEVNKYKGNFKIYSNGYKSGVSVEILLNFSLFQPVFAYNFEHDYGHQRVVIIDDNKDIHNLFLNKFSRTELLEIVTLTKINELKDYLTSFNSHQFQNFYFIDNNFTESDIKGVDVIQEYNLQNKSLLTTDDYRDDRLIKKCLDLGIKILPKNKIQNFRFKLNEHNEKIILIDDNITLCQAWRKLGKIKGIEVIYFNTIIEFENSEYKFQNALKLYIDFNLGSNEQSGYSYAKKLYYNLKFRRIYIISGMHQSINRDVEWIIDVLPKAVPF